MVMRKIKNKIKKVLFKLPISFRNKIYRIYNIVRYPEYRQKRLNCGLKNCDKTFYVIRPRTDGVEGLMSLYLNVLKNVSYADRMGYIPVVDFQNYRTQYTDKEEIENDWEKFFTQLSEWSLDEVYRSKNVIVSGLNVLISESENIEQEFTDSIIENARKLHNKYIRFSNRALDIVEKEIEGWDMSEMVGLYLRGTDYIDLRPSGHPVQPTFEDAAKIVDGLFETNSELKCIFLVTEDYKMYSAAKDYFGDKIRIVSFDSFISGYTGENFIGKDDTIKNQLASDAFTRGMNYLVKLIILSKCAFLVGGNTCGSWAATVFASKEQKRYIFDLGLY